MHEERFPPVEDEDQEDGAYEKVLQRRENDAEEGCLEECSERNFEQEEICEMLELHASEDDMMEDVGETDAGDEVRDSRKCKSIPERGARLEEQEHESENTQEHSHVEREEREA